MGMSDTSAQRPDRNLALELVRATESAALAAARWVGRGDKEGADGSYVELGPMKQHIQIDLEEAF